MPHATSINTSPMIRPSALPLGFITIPRGEQTDNTPKSAIIISPKTERILRTRMEDFQRWNWTQVKEVIKLNRIDLFERAPSDLKRYVEFVHYLKRTFGTVINFIQHERLHWSSLEPSDQTAFKNPTDYKILYNDWPYGIDTDIIHLVVWTKFELEEDSDTGDLTVEARAAIEAFVQQTFCGKDGVDRDNLVWFRNWKSLKSVHALEHFHVMLHRPDPEFLRKITGGDVAMAEKLRVGK